MKNLKISTQIQISIVITLLFVIFISIVSIVNNVKIYEQTETMYHHPVQVNRAIGILETEIMSIEVEMRNLNIPENFSHRNELLISIQNSKAIINQQFEIINRFYLGPKTDVIEAKNIFSTWNNDYDRYIKHISEGKTERDKIFSIDYGRQSIYRKNLLIKIHDIDTFAKNKSDFLHKTALELKNKLNKYLIFIVVLFIIFSITTYLLVINNILKPIKELVALNNKFKNGDFTVRSNSSLKNEFGILSDSFNDMVEAIQVNVESEKNRIENIYLDRIGESEEKFKSLFNRVADAIFIYNPDTFNIIEANDATSKLYGYAKEELVGESCLKFSAEVEKSKQVAEEIIQKGEAKINVRKHKRKDGSIIFVKLSGYQIMIKDKPITFSVCQDITYIIKAEQDLIKAKEIAEEREAVLRSYFKLGLLGMAITSTEKKWIEVNDTICQFLGYTREELDNLTWAELTHPDDVDIDQNLFNKVLTGEIDNYKIDKRFIRKDGEIIFTELSVACMRDLNGNVSYFTALINDITHRKVYENELLKAKNSLEENEVRLIEAQNSAKIGSWETNLQSLDVLWSQETFKIFELDSNNFKASHNAFLEFVHPDDKVKVDNAFVNSFKTDFYNSVEHRIITFNKNEKYVIERWKIIFDSEGKPLKAFGTCQDITEKKLVELELIKAKERAENNEQKLNEAQHLAKIGSWELDLKNNILNWSDEIYRIFGLKPQEFGATYEAFLSYIHPEDRELVNNAYANHLKTKEEYNIVHRVKLANNEIKYVNERCNSKYDTDGNAIWSMGTVADITESFLFENELKLAKEKAEENEIKFKAAFFTSPDSVNINKLDGEFVEINEGFTRLTGFTREDVIGKLSSEIDIWAIPEDREIMISSLKEFGLVENLETVFKSKKSDSTPALISAIIIKIKNEPHILSVTREISERKRFEQELILAKEKAEENERLKSAFLANMSHEIRTPMNGILGFADLLKEPNLTGEDQEMYVDIIINSGNRMLNIINDIVSMARLESNTMSIYKENTNINEVLSFIYVFFKPETEKKNILLSYNESRQYSDFIVYTDKEKLIAVLINLVKNAIKFTMEGKIEFGFELNEQYLEFYVKDTGIGLNEENKTLIFERFRQGDDSLSRNYEGAGLGLSISKAYIEMLGGKIWVESILGLGSTFKFTIQQ